MTEVASALSIQSVSFIKDLGIISLPAKDRDEDDTGPTFSFPRLAEEVEVWCPALWDLIDRWWPNW